MLGLEDLVAVQGLLSAARKERQGIWDDAIAGVAAIQALIEGIAAAGGIDERPERARTALQTGAWDLPALSDLIEDEGTNEASQIDLLRRLESVQCIDVEGVRGAIGKLRSTAKNLDDLAGSTTERSGQRANLLDQALRFHDQQQSEQCPVCGTPHALGARWATETRSEIARLRTEAAACEAATTAARTAVREAQRHLVSPPAVLAHAKDLGLAGLPEARQLWIAWSNGRDIEDPAALADYIEPRLLD